MLLEAPHPGFPKYPPSHPSTQCHELQGRPGTKLNPGPCIQLGVLGARKIDWGLGVDRPSPGRTLDMGLQFWRYQGSPIDNQSEKIVV